METGSEDSDTDAGTSNDYGSYGPNDFPFIEEEKQSIVLEAKTVYLLLPKNVPVSRIARLQWLLKNLNSVITMPTVQKNSGTEIEIISIIPRNPLVTKCNKFQITYRTELKFLAHSYRIVYCLDMSPSQATVDIQNGQVLFDDIFNCFKNSVEGLCDKFTVPGNQQTFNPSIFLTIMVNTPFFMSPAQQVLVKGVEITNSNLPDIIKIVYDQFQLIEGKIADIATLAHDQIDSHKVHFDHDDTIIVDTEKQYVNVHMVSPDANFVNMLRYSMLAMSLLPENSISHIIVITDGVVAPPDSNVLETLLFQLHYDSISVSFLKVGSSFHPHSNSGFVAYTDLLYFFAHSTLGSCIEIPCNNNVSLLEINPYHEIFLLWSFHTKNKYIAPRRCASKWISENKLFHNCTKPHLLTKRQSEEKSTASILILLSRRMRDGFTVDHISYINGLLEAKLSLEWKSSIFIYYKCATQWPVNKGNSTVYEVSTAAPYEFLHDISCVMKKENKSSHRVAVIERFWLRLSQLTSELSFAQQLSTFPSSALWYNLPESARSGIPVFVLNNIQHSDSSIKTNLIPNDVSCPKFFHLWQPICQMEGNNWRKWFHMHKISLILKHDQLPKSFHLNQSSRRYQIIQCRQAATALYGLLSEWCTFILIDNHTYLKLIFKESDRPPTSFCIIRITSKLPCAVLHVGFLTPTPGYLRKEILEQLKADLSSLAYATGLSRMKENAICILFEKPLEKILIRYERVPNDFSTVIFPDGTQPPHTSLNVSPPLTNSLFTTLSRYLYHKRCIWGASYPFNSRISDNAFSWILNTIIKMRLEEGFHFAHSSAGIVTMVIELWMDPLSSCLVQYVLFPADYSESNGWIGDSDSSSDDDHRDGGSESQLQLVTEVWIEPQHGKVQTTNKRIDYLNNKFYYEIANVISQIDHKCINSLLTMEHLSLVCQENNRSFAVISSSNFLNTSQRSLGKNSKDAFHEPSTEIGSQWSPIVTPRIQRIPFKFDLIAILPFCQQTEMLFSLFMEDADKTSPFTKSDITDANKLLVDNIHDYFAFLHDSELDLTNDESREFTMQIITRYENRHSSCPVSVNNFANDETDEDYAVPQWRCLLKGLSVTHVILTFIPATLNDLKALLSLEKFNILTQSNDKFRSRKNESESLTFPVYVYDCPLEVLINAHVKNLNANVNKDIQEDHRFRFIDDVYEDHERLKEEVSHGSPEPKSDESENSDCGRVHCRALVLAYSKSFVLSAFVSLHFGSYIHSFDIQSAVDQCEESSTEVDITTYILNVCGHMKNSIGDRIDMNSFNDTMPCSELAPLHNLIKKKFFHVINQSFEPVPSNREFYFYRNIPYVGNNTKQNDSDDDISNQSELRSENDIDIYCEPPQSLQRMESGFSGISDIVMADVCPLFLHLICTINYNGGMYHKSIRVLPTCLVEIIREVELACDGIDKSKVQINLDILCLTLPNKVQNIVADYTSKEFRSASFCSDGIQTSLGSPMSEISFPEMPELEPLMNLPEFQRKAIFHLRDEIKWLLKDEIATALLDAEPITMNILHSIVHHVSHSVGKSSCDLEKINCKFVYNTNESYEMFIKEFAKIAIPPYKLVKEGEYYYVVKENVSSKKYVDLFRFLSSKKGFEMKDNLEDDEKSSQQSDISSLKGSAFTDGAGYDEDISDCEDYEWLVNMDSKRVNLPNFWLIMKVDHDITMYFHCRFVELPTSKVGVYLQIRSSLRDAIRELCKRINQSLLLKYLYETKICDPLLEPDDNPKDWNAEFVVSSSRSVSYNRFKSVECSLTENSDETEVKANSDYSNFEVGEFSCPVVWQTNFGLHPRLKTGPGKSIISRGILALKNILDKFSVANRNNMFVYKDQMNNVFYLRLQENMHMASAKSSSMRPNEYENALVSRSPSIASLPLGQREALLHSDSSILSSAASEIRPRVRSFGEKESKNSPEEDTLILKVHGITSAGADVQCDLVQVLQNRLDDAVLEFLSITLSRNAMCPLTPEDVHFIQKPFRPPEVVIRLTVEDFTLGYLESFIHYLKQNLLQFLNIPKYADLRSHYHFKDFPENDSANNMVTGDNIFIYNQSQNPSSGNRGIACIVLNLMNDSKKQVVPLDSFIFGSKKSGNIISTRVIKPEETLPDVYLEFRLWKQGRVNIDNLIEKLICTVHQSSWDLIMEYFLLSKPLCVDCTPELKASIRTIVRVSSPYFDNSKEVEFIVLMTNKKSRGQQSLVYTISKPLAVSKNKRRPKIPIKRKTSRSITFDSKDRVISKSKKSDYKSCIEGNSLETGSEGMLSDIYSKFLPEWFEYGVTLSVPTVRRHRVTLPYRHLVSATIRELTNVIQDTSKTFAAIPTNSLKTDDDYNYIVYQPSSTVQKCVIIARNFEQWKATVSHKNSPEISEIISPHALKHIQKFTPLAGNVFVPRQKILWAFVESDNITLYTYNWTKDKIENLVANCSNLGLWLTVRSCFLNSLTCQKLGLFHNQPLARKNFLSSNNPFACYVGNIDFMSELPKELPRRTIVNTNLSRSLDVFREAFQKILPYLNDIVVVLTSEMYEIKLYEEKWNEEMKKLHSMYQSRTSSTTVPSIFLLMQHSRLIHYCHTPLLFLPRWRLKSASTRDHSLHPCTPGDEIILSEDSWHNDLCYEFFCEYRRYLQTLGFIPLQFDNLHRKPGLWLKDSSSYDSVFFIQKTILGGILLFTAEFIEPFFATKLHAIECNRLQNISLKASINRFTLSFLDECDRVKIYMHLHSFTYDYHLRSIYNYITNAGALQFIDNYHVNQFLDDFLKYYNKAPNFARNLVYEDILTIKDLLTEGQQLYDFLLKHVTQYNFKALEMENSKGEQEQILVQVTTTSQIYYTDSQDHQYTDDFDVTIVVHNSCSPYNPHDNVLHLKYYLILTSKRELYPPPGREEALGKFRTVSSASRSILGTSRETEDYPNAITVELGRINEDEEEIIVASEKEQEEIETYDKKDDFHLHSEISAEEVNYLGYYSSHEQLMHQLILEKAKATRNQITEMVTKGMVHCRSNFLWSKLVSSDSPLTYNEFIELKSLANLQLLCNIHPHLSPLLYQSFAWYEGLSKLLLTKYSDHKRIFISPNGNMQYYVILHPTYYGAFMLLSMDVHMARGDLYAVYKDIGENEGVDACRAYRKQLLDGFVSCIAFYLWVGLI